MIVSLSSRTVPVVRVGSTDGAEEESEAVCHHLQLGHTRPFIHPPPQSTIPLHHQSRRYYDSYDRFHNYYLALL